MSLPLGVGLGWRPETALLVERRLRAGTLAFTEVVAETIDPRRLPPALAFAIERGLPVVAHGVGLDLGGVDPLDPSRVKRFAEVVRALRSPLASEHVAFCRARDRESPHFLPVPYTRTQLAVLVDKVRRLQDALPVPLALENVAAPLVWPGPELAEADFLAELVERTGAQLLLDASNVHANLVNHGGDLDRYLGRLPLDRIAYMHAAGGAHVAPTGMYRDTHAHPMAPPVLATLAAILARTGAVPLLLERDHHHDRAVGDELDALGQLLAAAPVRETPAARAARVPRADLDERARAELGACHAMLLAAVLEEGAIPAGFDPRHVAEARSIVDAKRRRARVS